MTIRRLSFVAALVGLSVLAAGDLSSPAGNKTAADPPRVSIGGYGARIYAPAATKKAGALPVLLFATGFGSLVPSQFYGQLLTDLAGQGFIAIGLDRFKFINYPQAGKDFSEALRWVQNGGLVKEMSQQGLTAEADLKRVVVMGQSSGNHVVGQALADGCQGVSAWVMIDPVDGVDPYHFVKTQDLIVPGKLLNFTLPSLIIRNGLDPKTTSPAFPACAPAEMSNDRFFYAMRGPTWMVNATAYGHIDCLDQAGFPADWVCPTNTSTDKTAYKHMLADATSTFLGALFGTRPKADLDRLEDLKRFDVNVVLDRDLKGLSHAAIQPGCANVADADVVVV